jgi:peroxiredoxin
VSILLCFNGIINGAMKKYIRTRVRLHAQFIFFILLILPSAAFGISLEFGTKAPDFELSSVKNESFALSQYKGSIVILVYVRPDQKRSLTALKDLQELLEKHGDKGVKVLAITAESAEEEIKNIIEDLEIEFPLLLDTDRDVYGGYGIRVYPTTLILDREGILVDVLSGYALTYKIKIDGALQYRLGEIDKQKLRELIMPTKEEKDEAAIHAERRYNLALSLSRSRNVNHAIVMAKRSLEDKPDFIQSHVLLGFLYLEKNEMDLAIDRFRTALNIDPKSKDAKTGLGSALLQKGEIESAMNILSAALSSNPYPERTYYELGKVYSKKGNSDMAIDMFKKALEKAMKKGVLPRQISKCK